MCLEVLFTLLFLYTEVEDVVNTTVFLLSDKAAMINGVIMPVDGGMDVMELSRGSIVFNILSRIYCPFYIRKTFLLGV